MSINHAKQKRNNKKCSAASTAAVYPIVQNLPNASVPDIATSAISTTCYVRGQCVRARAVVEANLVTSVAELVSEVIPQGTNQSQSQNEPVYWVKVQKCVTDLRGRQTTHVVVLGLARGYQIWMILENGDCEEVVSERKGPLKVGHLLPFVTEGKDRFREQRPLFALVDGNPMSAERKFCSVTFLSLKQGKTNHALNFENPIIDLESSVKCLLVVFAENIVICDQETLTERYCVVVPSSPDLSFSPNFALSDNLLAFADSSINKNVQSCGGAVFDDELSYGGQVMSAAKSLSKTVTSISESFVSSFSTAGNKTGSIKDPGIVSVIDVSALSSCDEQASQPQHYVAHFVAHDSPVGFLAFGNGGQLLFTSNLSATTFHLFLLQPHPTPTLSSVQHLYTLHRGNSIAKVIDCTFSADNRWLAVSTNHGTTHVFAITPYGGPVSMRTHGGKFVNKESRFERTAGLTSEHLTRTVHHSTSRGNTASSPAFKEHPSMTNAVVARTVVNPRLTHYTSPVVLWSLGKIKQRPFSAGNLSAWASDNAIVSLGAGRQNGRNSVNVAAWLSDSSRRISAAFGTPCSDETSTFDYPALTVMNAEGILTQYRVEIRRERHNSTGSTSSLNVNDVLSSSPATGGFHPNGVSPKVTQAGPDAPVRIKVLPISQWALTRNKGASGVDVIDPPLHENNPILRVLDNDRSSRKSSKKEPSDTAWLPHVEVLTYSGPHRRLWMGPQFSFGVYAPSGHSSAQLFNPNDSGGVKIPYLNAQKCCPVLIEKNSPALGILSCDTSCDAASKIVCGSWSSELDFKTAFDDGTYAAVKEKIEDAMKDMDLFDEPASDSSSKSDSPNSLGNQDLLLLSGMEL